MRADLDTKKAQVANFNIVFGEKEEPMLDYFDSIIYPALESGITKKSNGMEYMIKNVSILENSRKEYVLVGRIVKKTILEVFSDLDEKGDLIEKEEKVSAAPYSTFVIYLKNHRMLFVANQKGSPSLVNFRSSISFIICRYISLENKKRNLKEKLPEPLINIVGIPSSRSMEEVLKGVQKVNKLTLRFYPLNGDIDFSGMFSQMTTDLRKIVGCKTGETVLNSPRSVNGIVQVLEQAGGTINPILNVTTKENSDLTIRDYQISEQYRLHIDDDKDLEQEMIQIIGEGDKIESLKYSNDEHVKIYDKNKIKVKNLKL